jgi:hypothetical protein
VRPEAVQDLARSPTYLGTSHRQRRALGVEAIRAGLSDLFSLPDGCEVSSATVGAPPSGMPPRSDWSTTAPSTW